MTSYLEEIEEVRLIAKIQEDCRYRAKEKQHRAENERKEMRAQLAKAIEDWTVTEDFLLIEQKQAENLSQDLAVLQE